ncbi:MAG: sulfurtransferase complex subunit TusC [Gammaproteobacteria bacterium]|nr:sulfurtransferase complex subunit TusC [Gammaproteobacteria bacterium]
MLDGDEAPDDPRDGGSVGKRILIVNQRPPHGSILAQEALEVVMIAAAFEQAVSLLFIDDGVWQLKSGQQPETLRMKNFSKTFAALPDFDVEDVYVDVESLTAAGLEVESLCIEVQLCDRASARRLIETSDVVLTF